MHWFQIVTTKDSTRGVHFRRAGPREKVIPYSDHVCRNLKDEPRTL